MLNQRHSNTSNVTANSRIALELAVLTAVLGAVWYAFAAVIYPSWGIEHDAPIPARSIVAVLLIFLFLRASGGGLRDIGLARPKRIWLTVLLGLGYIGIEIVALMPFVEVVVQRLGMEPETNTAFEHVEGNELALAGWLIVVWTAAAFGEEILFRGYLIGRLSQLFGGGPIAISMAIVAQAVLFGLGHAYQGTYAIIVTGIFALSFGIFYQLIGRNLWPLVIAHGLIDTLGLTVIYFMGVPTV